MQAKTIKQIDKQTLGSVHVEYPPMMGRRFHIHPEDNKLSLSED